VNKQLIFFAILLMGCQSRLVEYRRISPEEVVVRDHGKIVELTPVFSRWTSAFGNSFSVTLIRDFSDENKGLEINKLMMRMEKVIREATNARNRSLAFLAISRFQLKEDVQFIVSLDPLVIGLVSVRGLAPKNIQEIVDTPTRPWVVPAIAHYELYELMVFEPGSDVFDHRVRTSELFIRRISLDPIMSVGDVIKSLPELIGE